MIVIARDLELVELLSSDMRIPLLEKSATDLSRQVEHLVRSSFLMDGTKHPYVPLFELKSHTVEVALCMAYLIATNQREISFRLWNQLEDYIRRQGRNQNTGFRLLNTLLATLTR